MAQNSRHKVTDCGANYIELQSVAPVSQRNSVEM